MPADALPPSQLRPSIELRRFIERPENEGKRLKVYCCPGGEWTIGSGHTRGVGPHTEPITEEQRELYLTEDLEAAAKVVRTWVTVPLTQGQFDALTDLVFNVGPGEPGKRDGFVWLSRRNGARPVHSTILTLLNNGDYAGAALELPKWRKSAGRVLEGLVNRRAHALAVFQGGAWPD